MFFCFWIYRLKENVFSMIEFGIPKFRIQNIGGKKRKEIYKSMDMKWVFGY